MSISSVLEFDLSLISFAESDSTLTCQGGDKRRRRRQEGLGAIIHKAVIILNISF